VNMIIKKKAHILEVEHDDKDWRLGPS